MHRIDEPHPFSLETATLHYAEDRPAAAQHLALELDLDFEKHSLSGVVTHSLVAQRALKQLTFDAVDLQVTKVEVDGKAAEFDAASGRSLTVYLPRALKTDAAFEVRISYRASPQRGLYFVGKTQAWTQ